MDFYTYNFIMSRGLCRVGDLYQILLLENMPKWGLRWFSLSPFFLVVTVQAFLCHPLSSVCIGFSGAFT